MACLDENLLAELVEGRLSTDARAFIDRHIDGCGECRDLVAALAGAAELARGTLVSEASSTLIRSGGKKDEGTDEPPMLGAGEMVDHFRVLRRLGAGGMGEVYVAQDTKLGRKVALKVIRPGMMSDESALRFEREAQAMARVTHPNIVMVHEIGTRLGAPYAAMEFVEGESLGARLAYERLTTDEAIRVATAVAEAIEVAHRRGIVHRDLKPDNILLSSDGRVRVADFGLAAIANVEDADSYAATFVDIADPLHGIGTGACGTPGFMAPEQWEGGEMTGAADVWAIGVILYLLLANQYPFHSDDMTDLARRVLFKEPTPLPADFCPAALGPVIMACLQKEPNRRPTVTALKEALQAEKLTNGSHPSNNPGLPLASVGQTPALQGERTARDSTSAPSERPLPERTGRLSASSEREAPSSEARHDARPPAARPWGRLALAAFTLIVAMSIGGLVALFLSAEPTVVVSPVIESSAEAVAATALPNEPTKLPPSMVTSEPVVAPTNESSEVPSTNPPKSVFDRAPTGRPTEKEAPTAKPPATYDPNPY